MKSKIFLWTLILSSIIFVTCSSIENTQKNDSYQFTNKWWFSTINSSLLQQYFNSNGTYESKKLNTGVTITSSGQWEWVDEQNKIFRVYNLTDNESIPFYGKITNISANSLQIVISFDNGANYSSPYDFMDNGN